MSDDKTIVCPKCHTECEQNSEECIKCGLNFDKYNKRRNVLFKQAMNFFEKNQLDEARQKFDTVSSEYPEVASKANEYIERINKLTKESLYNNALDSYENNRLDDAKDKFQEISSKYDDLTDSAKNYIKKIDQQKKDNLFKAAKRDLREGRLLDAEYKFKKVSNAYPDLADKANMHIEEIKRKKPKNNFDSIGFLKFFAWLDLCGGIIGAIWIWSAMGTTKVSGYSTLTAANPYGIVFGFAVFFQGIFLCALFLVICSIAENLIEIRKNTQN